MKTITLSIPEGVAFQDLKITRDSVTLDIEFEMTPINRILSHNGVDGANIDENIISALLISWYKADLSNGGQPHPVMEQIAAEIERDKILTAAEAVEYGLIDKVMASRKAKPSA